MNRMFFVLLLTAVCSMISARGVFAQDSTDVTRAHYDRMDSLERSNDAREMREQVSRDKKSLSDLKSDRSDTKQKATEARRVESDANDAARESRAAYRSEKKAQKARMQADKQARKASKARSISDEN